MPGDGAYSKTITDDEIFRHSSVARCVASRSSRCRQVDQEIMNLVIVIS